jgi:signal transduction histidine kinase
MPGEPRLRILVAEVQSRSGAPFVAPEATPYEERMTRQNARLRLELAEARREHAAAKRLLEALAQADPGESPEDWSARAALAWCAAPEINSARVAWVESGFVSTAGAGETEGAPGDFKPSEPAPTDRPPTLVLPLVHRGRASARVELWSDRDRFELEDRLRQTSILGPWQSWAALVADRALLERRLQSVVASYCNQIETEEDRLSARKLDSVAEFAAGAGHELNNPLAVVVGRAQLLLARTADPETSRSLEIIRNQASRAHRILRDLMFVARPPAPRRRTIRPAETFTSSVRDLQAECARRGVRLESEVDDSLPAISADPEALRHLTETLVRNALEATPSGGRIVVRLSREGEDLHLSISDTGKGFSPGEAVHLLDPFYCGRQAGRGLGLGLPRAARMIALSGGHLRWTSTPGHGSIFEVHLPRSVQPEKPDHSLARRRAKS